MGARPLRSSTPFFAGAEPRQQPSAALDRESAGCLCPLSRREPNGVQRPGSSFSPVARPSETRQFAAERFRQRNKVLKKKKKKKKRRPPQTLQIVHAKSIRAWRNQTLTRFRATPGPSTVPPTTTLGPPDFGLARAGALARARAAVLRFRPDRPFEILPQRSFSRIGLGTGLVLEPSPRRTLPPPLIWPNSSFTASGFLMCFPGHAGPSARRPPPSARHSSRAWTSQAPWRGGGGGGVRTASMLTSRFGDCALGSFAARLFPTTSPESRRH